MTEIFLALKRSLGSLRHGKTWLYLLTPAIASLLFMIGLVIFSLKRLIDAFIEQPPMTWIAEWGAFWLAKFFAVIGGWLVIFSASYMLSMLLAAIIILPLMLKVLASNDYADLARMGDDSFSASTFNSVSAAILFMLGWVLTLPLWLIPGLGLILPFFWMAWLNRRTFGYDALAVHASAEEWRTLRAQHAMPLLLLGGIMALIAHVPIIGMLAPSVAALAYLHYCLEALRRLRQGAVLSV